MSTIDNATILANITAAAKASVATDATLAEIQDLAARHTGLLFAAVSVGFDAKIKAKALAAAATDGGYECDDTTAGKIARAGRIVLIDKPVDATDAIYGWGGAAYTAVCNAVRVGTSLKDIDKAIAKAASTDEAIKALNDGTKAAKDAKKAEAEAEAEAAIPSGDDAIVATAQWLDASLKNLLKAITQGVVTDANLTVLRAIAETAGAAALLVEAGADAEVNEPVAV